MKKILLILTAVLLLLPLTSCDKDIEVETNVKYTVYENEGVDMVSFYMTSDTEKDGEWRYSVDGLSFLGVFYESNQAEENASYRTLILKPTAEGEDNISFSLNDGRTSEYLIKAAKDDSGIIRIKVEEPKR